MVVGWEIVLRADTWEGFVASGRQWDKKDHREGHTFGAFEWKADRQTKTGRPAGGWADAGAGERIDGQTDSRDACVCLCV